MPHEFPCSGVALMENDLKATLAAMHHQTGITKHAVSRGDCRDALGIDDTLTQGPVVSAGTGKVSCVASPAGMISGETDRLTTATGRAQRALHALQGAETPAGGNNRAVMLRYRNAAAAARGYARSLVKRDTDTNAAAAGNAGSRSETRRTGIITIASS